MIRTALQILTFAACHISCQGNSLSVDTGQHSISILTYNVNWGFINPSVTRDIICAEDADIVCLQETNVDWEAYLIPSICNQYRYIEFRHAPGAGGLAILSKYPFNTKAVVQAERGWFPLWLVEVEMDSTKIQVFNLHLKPGINQNGRIGWFGDAWFRSHKIHREELELCLAEVDSTSPLFLLGDINENDRNKGCRWLRKSGFNDALKQLPKRVKTWYWDMGYLALKGRYDHIFYRGQVMCYDTEVIRAGNSDHFPVVGHFKIN